MFRYFSDSRYWRIDYVLFSIVMESVIVFFHNRGAPSGYHIYSIYNYYKRKKFGWNFLFIIWLPIVNDLKYFASVVVLKHEQILKDLVTLYM